MASSLASYILGDAQLKFVNDADGVTYFKDLVISSVDIAIDADVTDVPLSIVEFTDDDSFDNLLQADVESVKILRPPKMKIRAFCNNLSTVECVLAAWMTTIFTYTVTSKTLIADSMMIVSVDVNQTSQMTSAVELIIELEQSAPIDPSKFDAANDADQPSNGVRIVEPESAILNTIRGIGDSVSSSVESLYNKVSSVF